MGMVCTTGPAPVRSTAARPGREREGVGRRAELLLVEDNAADVRLMRETLADQRVHLNVVTHAEAALRFIRRVGEYSDVNVPDLVLLDLNLDGMSGLDLLQEIKGDREICQIPVIVFTSSDSEADVAAAYAMKANCYVPKPFEPARYRQALMLILELWVGMAQLPHATPRSV